MLRDFCEPLVNETLWQNYKRRLDLLSRFFECHTTWAYEFQIRVVFWSLPATNGCRASLQAEGTFDGVTGLIGYVVHLCVAFLGFSLNKVKVL